MGEMLNSSYNAFRTTPPPSEVASPLYSDGGIDPTSYNVARYEETPLAEDDVNSYLYILAPGTSREVLNVAAVTVSSTTDLNRKYQIIRGATISDAIVQTQDTVIR